MRRLNIRNKKSLILIIFIFLTYLIMLMDVPNKLANCFQYSMYRYVDGTITKHFTRFSWLKKSESVDEMLLEQINNQMYGINYLYDEGRRQNIAKNDSNYLTEYKKKEDEKIVKDEDETKEEEVKKNNDDDFVEVMMPVKTKDAIVYSKEQLNDFDFLMSHLYIVPARAKVLESDLVADEMLAKDMTIKGSSDKPQILVYHTHSQEAFADSGNDKNKTIVHVGDYLTELLTEYGFNVIHCKKSFDVDENGNLDRSNAYVNALPEVLQILEDNPSIEVVLDIHRDGLPEGVDKLVTNINGKQTAKIMFFNGLSRSSAVGEIDYLYNQYRSENLALSFQAKLKAMEYYPDFTRKSYLDAYQYNLHVKDKAMLIEVGAQNNTFDEAKNAMEPLANILYMVFAGK